MMNTKDRILFFASGDFAIPTFLDMVKRGYNIVGLVTSNDKCHFNEKRISDYAFEYDLPFITIDKSGKFTDEAISFIRMREADIFCVISFKYLPNEVLSLAKKTSFNVHASILPFLKGAAPINWAIRLSCKKTGLTSFILNEKIDGGDILSIQHEEICSNDTYESLFKRLSDKCVNFTENVIDNILSKDDFKERAIPQASVKSLFYEGVYNDDIFFAPKINRDYFYLYKRCPSFDIEAICRSVYPIEGMPSVIIIKNKAGHTVKKLNCKVFSVKAYGCSLNMGNGGIESPNVWSDGKSYLRVTDNSYTNTIYDINEIQLEGKKRLPITEFLKGFQYIRQKDEYSIIFKMSSYKENWSFAFSFEVYLQRIKESLICNSSEEDIKTYGGFSYTMDQIDGNLPYFKQAYEDMLSPFKALEMFYFKLREKTNNGI